MNAPMERGATWLVGGPDLIAVAVGEPPRWCVWRQSLLSGVVEWREVSRDFSGDPRTLFAEEERP